ncbi:MAG: 30S ribosomal protein S6 [Kamptonema sp. SIO4C4]|nr:30S ribosomal protein S6 [Kamptonema sp. SIO4C4]
MTRIRSYEMMYIVRPDLSEDRTTEVINQYRDLLKEQGATDVQIQVLGKRRLAYPIDRHQEGVYVQVNYQGEGNQVKPVERMMRLSEEVIRYLTLKLEENKVNTDETVPPSAVEETVG